MQGAIHVAGIPAQILCDDRIGHHVDRPRSSQSPIAIAVDHADHVQIRSGDLDPKARPREVHRDHRAHHRRLGSPILLRVVDRVGRARPRRPSTDRRQHSLGERLGAVG
jgi:hypothetical protein